MFPELVYELVPELVAKLVPELVPYKGLTDIYWFKINIITKQIKFT